MRGHSDGLCLEVLFQDRAVVTDAACTKCVEVLGSEAGDAVECCRDAVQGLDFRFALGDVFLEYLERGRHKLVRHVFQVERVVQVVDCLRSLQIKTQSQLRIIRLQQLEQLCNQLEQSLLAYAYLGLGLVRTLLLYLYRSDLPVIDCLSKSDYTEN